MPAEQPDGRRKNYMMMRSIMDYGMGLVILGVGVFFIISDKFGVDFSIEPFFKYFFAVMCIIYGAWRMYRGYKKNYYSE